jgi:hypothetical protein
LSRAFFFACDFLRRIFIETRLSNLAMVGAPVAELLRAG